MRNCGARACKRKLLVLRSCSRLAFSLSPGALSSWMGDVQGKADIWLEWQQRSGRTVTKDQRFSSERVFLSQQLSGSCGEARSCWPGALFMGAVGSATSWPQNTANITRNLFFRRQVPVVVAGVCRGLSAERVFCGHELSVCKWIAVHIGGNSECPKSST